MKRADIPFAIGLLVTVVTTLATPGGLLASFIIGTGSGVLAVGVATLALDRLSR